MKTERFKSVLLAILIIVSLMVPAMMLLSVGQVSASWPDYVIVQGSAACYSEDRNAPPPSKFYEPGDMPPIMAAKRIGDGAVIAAGLGRTCNGGVTYTPQRWTVGELDVLLDCAFQWMKPGATKVLWYGEYDSSLLEEDKYEYTFSDAKCCSWLIDSLETKGYVVDDSVDGTFTPITSSLLDPYDILVLPGLQVGEGSPEGGNPDLLPDDVVAAITDFVKVKGRGLFIMDCGDYDGYCFHRVNNKILEALGFGVFFQNDTVADPETDPGVLKYATADVNITADIGAAYQAATGKTTIKLYKVPSLYEARRFYLAPDGYARSTCTLIVTDNDCVVATLGPNAYNINCENDHVKHTPSPEPEIYYHPGDLIPVMAAAEVGLGRVVVFGSANTFGGEAGGVTARTYGADKLLINAYKWLDQKHEKKILWYESHGVYFKLINNEDHRGDCIAWANILRTEEGYTVDGTGYNKNDPYAYPITAEMLAPYSILQLNNPEYNPTYGLENSEISAINDWVRAGGGLFLVPQSDYHEWFAPYAHFAAICNAILEPLDVSFRFQDDEAVDNEEFIERPEYPRMYYTDHEIVPDDVMLTISPEYQETWPRGSFAFDVTVQNIGPHRDSYTLEYGHTATDWDLEFSPYVMLNVDPGEKRPVTLRITIPSDANIGAEDNIFIKVTSQSDPTITKTAHCILHAARNIRPPTDDAYTHEGRPDLKTGGLINMFVGWYKHATQGVGGSERTWLKFDLSALPADATICRVRLWLYCYFLTGWGSHDTRCYSLENDDWTEEAIIWNNQPPTIGGQLGDAQTIEEAGEWYSWEVGSFVQSERTKDNIVSFCLIDQDENVENGHSPWFYSKEFGTYENAGLWPFLQFLPRRAEIRTVIYPAADVYAFSGDGTRYSRSQLKFDIGSIPSGSKILSAKLWLYRFAADNWDGEVLLNRVDDQPWSENITAIEFDAETLTNEETRASKFMSPGWDYLDVEDQLNADHEAGHAYSSYRLRWANDDGSEPSVGIDDGRFLVIESELDELCIFFPSSEYNGSDPYLEVVYVPPHAVSVSISPTYRSGAPGEELSCSVMVANIGNLDDNYVLTVSDDAGWGPTVFPASLAVASGTIGEATLAITVPENAAPCTSNNVTVTATSQTDNTVSDNDSCTAHVEVVRGVEVSILPDYQENLPGGTLEYTVAVRNLGNVDDNYDFIAQDTENWGPTFEDNLLEVPAGENRQTTLSVTIPENAAPCTEDNITITAISQADNAIRDNASCITHAVAAPSPPSVEVSPFVNLGEAGDNLPYMVTVTNVGDIADNYTITVMDNLAWPISVSENEISLAPDENVVIVVKVTVPEDLTEKVADWITLKASGVSGAENSVDFRAISVMPLEEPPYPVAHPEENYYWFSTCTLRVESPAVPIMCGRETGYSVDMTPREPWPMLYGRGEYPLAGAAAIVGNGRVIAQGGLGILRSAPVDQFGDERLAAKKLMPLMVQWLIDWGDPSEHRFLFYCTSGAFHNASRLSEWLNTLENSLGFELDTQEGGMITPELLENYDVLHIVVETSISDNEVHAIADWVENGGALLLMEQGDYAGAGNVPATNEILEALGCSIRFQDDELYDDNHWTKDGPWFPQVYLLDPREVDSEFDIWFPPSIEWDALITATFSGGSDDAIFGARLDASSGFDSKYDIPKPPAPPEPPYVRAYFYYPEQTPDELYSSCLAPENLMEWPLRIGYADDIENITLTWNVENIPSEYKVLLYRGGASVADMRAEDNYTFEATSDNHDFRVIVGKLLPFTLELTQGWNMISFPILLENMSPDSIFDSYYVLYRWDAENKRYLLYADSGSFIEPDPNVEVGVGYWAYVLEDENVDLLGFLVNRLTLNLRSGWNLIGTPYGGSSIADPIDDPDNSVLPWAFTWNAREKRYDMTQLLEAGKGYWTYALYDCTLTLMPK